MLLIALFLLLTICVIVITLQWQSQSHLVDDLKAANGNSDEFERRLFTSNRDLTEIKSDRDDLADLLVKSDCRGDYLRHVVKGYRTSFDPPAMLNGRQFQQAIIERVAKKHDFGADDIASTVKEFWETLALNELTVPDMLRRDAKSREDCFATASSLLSIVSREAWELIDLMEERGNLESASCRDWFVFNRVQYASENYQSAVGVG